MIEPEYTKYPNEVISVSLPILGKAKISFYSISAVVIHLYKWCQEFERQKTINHLGLIAHSIEGVKHTRYDYVLLECLLAEILDNFHKGGKDTQGSIKIDGIE